MEYFFDDTFSGKEAGAETEGEGVDGDGDDELIEDVVHDDDEAKADGLALESDDMVVEEETHVPAVAFLKQHRSEDLFIFSHCDWRTARRLTPTFCASQACECRNIFEMVE